METIIGEKSDNCVLIVDDCYFNSTAIESLLDQFNMKSEICEDGSKALEQIRMRVSTKKPMYRLILMDYSMPVLDGPRCTTAIRCYLNEKDIK